MISAEPPRTAYDLHFALAGVNVRVHPFFWLATVLLGARANTPPWVVLLWVAVVFVSILIHEFGHAFAFRRFGRDCHVVLYMLGGLAVPDDRYGDWSYGTKDEDATRSQVLIALAGPAAGFLFAALVAAGVYASGYHFEYSSAVGEWLSFELGSPQRPIENEKLLVCIWFILDVNLIWGLVNLLPVFPLDGGQVSRELFEKYRPSDGLRQALVLSIAVAAAVAALGLLKYRDLFIALMFGSLAYVNYRLMKDVTRGYGGYGGDRPW